MKLLCKLAIAFSIFAGCFSYIEEENHHDPELFQSDMRLLPMQRLLAETGGDVSIAGLPRSRASRKDVSKLWLPERIVPYDITPALEAEPEAILGIMLAFREWESYTCIKFQRRKLEKHYIEFFMNCSGCWSYVGRVGDELGFGGKQNICLSSGCWGKGTIVHEVAHAMGFWHEQSRPDRDQYIRVVWPNIPESKKHNFKKHNNSEVDSLGTSYDYFSVMQYSKTAFGINGSVTMDPIKSGVFQLGQRVGFTDIDAGQANALYRCKGATTRKPIVQPKYELNGIHDCTFDHGRCHFVQDTNDDFDWTMRVGSTPSWGTGPRADHTTGRMGRFMYIETSSPRKEGHTARLSSKLFSSTKGSCITFFYHMYAADSSKMGAFKVYLRQQGNQGNGNLLFLMSGDQGNKWQKQSLPLVSYKPYQIVFEGIRGKSYQGDISIDDISFSDGACAPVPTSPPQPPAICEDVNDREAQYCSQWAKNKFCTRFEQEMALFCPKTCKFC